MVQFVDVSMSKQPIQGRTAIKPRRRDDARRDAILASRKRAPASSAEIERAVAQLVKHVERRDWAAVIETACKLRELEAVAAALR